MKCASAKAGIASVMVGVAVVLSGAPAHATFIYLNQSHSIGASASPIASSSGGSPTTDLQSSDAGNSYAASYSGFQWTSLRSAARADSALLRHRADLPASSAVATGSSAANAPAKDSSAGPGDATAPSAPAVTAPAVNVSGPSTSIGSSPTVTAPIVIGVPTKTVPEPSTVGLLGIGLLLTCVAIRRDKGGVRIRR